MRKLALTTAVFLALSAAACSKPAATTETGMYCWGHELGSYKSLENAASVEFATQMRRTVERQLLANTLPELRPYFEKIFADPVYVEADQAVRKFLQEDTVTKHRFNPDDLAAWRELAEKKRYALLVQMQPYVLNELQTFAGDYIDRVKRERIWMIALLAGTLALSGAAAWLMGRGGPDDAVYVMAMAWQAWHYAPRLITGGAVALCFAVVPLAGAILLFEALRLRAWTCGS